jgi:hypothetical protein
MPRKHLLVRASGSDAAEPERQWMYNRQSSSGGVALERRRRYTRQSSSDAVALETAISPLQAQLGEGQMASHRQH